MKNNLVFGTLKKPKFQDKNYVILEAFDFFLNN
ncbi:hypothetical protein GvMRE_IIg575 [endosymbiont GvMRE of Glomus versiforme]|nr:hypothetical protein GvMRE_IIg575 [endosymbiont GvMRE of Glomus versiforme]